MDLYAEDLPDYIYQENDVNKKRALLLEVETEIKKLMGEQEKGGGLIWDISVQHR